MLDNEIGISVTYGHGMLPWREGNPFRTLGDLAF